MHKKAQIIVTDLFVAVAIFILLMSIVVIGWSRYTRKLDNKISYEEMQIKTFQTTNLLTKNQGKPTGWEKNPGSVEILGLASRDRILSAAKVNGFANLSYENATKFLNIRIYDFYFQIKDFENNTLTSAGKIPAGDYSVGLKRYVIYENEKAIFEFILWK